MNKLFIGNTDRSWFDFLAQRTEIEEVNFWQPGGRTVFRAISPGELFLFRLKSPVNKIAGGGYFEWADRVPLSAAWEIFQTGNGVSSLAELQQKIERYRAAPIASPYTTDIGCIILRNVFFLEPQDWIAVPQDFPLNVVKGKSYDVESESGAQLVQAIASSRYAPLHDLHVAEDTEPYEVPGGFIMGMVKNRIGQGAFRGMVLETYQRRCAVTGAKVLPILQSAHIQPVSAGGLHHIRNGILMRSDVHALFDLGYLTITPDLTIRASRRLRDEFNNGEDYRRLDGQRLWVPPTVARQPHPELLEWHADVVFRK